MANSTRTTVEGMQAAHSSLTNCSQTIEQSKQRVQSEATALAAASQGRASVAFDRAMQSYRADCDAIIAKLRWVQDQMDQNKNSVRSADDVTDAAARSAASAMIIG